MAIWSDAMDKWSYPPRHRNPETCMRSEFTTFSPRCGFTHPSKTSKEGLIRIHNWKPVHNNVFCNVANNSSFKNDDQSKELELNLNIGTTHVGT